MISSTIFPPDVLGGSAASETRWIVTPKKCIVKGLTVNVVGPTKTLYILNAKVVLIAVWGGARPDKHSYPSNNKC